MKTILNLFRPKTVTNFKRGTINKNRLSTNQHGRKSVELVIRKIEMTKTQQNHQAELDNIQFMLAFQKTKKEIADDKDLKQILALLLVPAIAMLIYVSLVIGNL